VLSYKTGELANQFGPYQAVQKGDVLAHQPSIASHWENFCSEKQHKAPSSSVILIIQNKCIGGHVKHQYFSFIFKPNI
jgi:hypothetical protein